MSQTHAIGRRKTSVARVYIKPGTGTVIINHRDLKNYFGTAALQYKVLQPFALTNLVDQYDVKVNVEGGGITGQAEAIRMAISRCLVTINSENRPMFAHPRSAHGGTQEVRSEESPQALPVLQTLIDLFFYRFV
jgi:small subunit ribosomal protein S9